MRNVENQFKPPHHALSNMDLESADLITDGWFSEKEAMWPGQRFGLKVKEVLFRGKTDFQDVLIFDSEQYVPLSSSTG